MKKVIKKVVAKAPVKKTVAKKPMMKSGGSKKPFRKTQDGVNYPNFQGPMTESAQKEYDNYKKIAEDAQKANIIYGPQGTFDKAYETDMRDLNRKNRIYRATSSTYKKKGGAIKATAKKIMVKSKKK